MAVPKPEKIRSFIIESIDLWNAQDHEAFFRVYREMAPGGFRFEMPVGSTVAQGWAPLEKMWQDYAPHVRIEIRKLIVNGYEAAAMMANLARSGATAHDVPSIETYHFYQDGSFLARYYADM